MEQLQAIVHDLQTSPQKLVSSGSSKKIECSQGVLIAEHVLDELVKTINEDDGYLCD